MKFTLSHKLIFATAAIIVSSVATVTVTMNYLSERETRSAVTKSIELAASAVANSVRNDIVEVASAGKTMADMIGDRHARGFIDRKDVISSLKVNLDSVPTSTGSWFLEAPNHGFDHRSDIVSDPSLGANSKGNFMPTWSRRLDGDYDFIAYELDYSSAFYTVAAETKKVFISEPYLDTGTKDPQLEMSIVFPVMSQGKIIGVSGIDLGLKPTSERLSSIKPMDVGSVSLLSGDGLWIAAQDPSLLTKPYGNAPGSTELAASVATGKPVTIASMTAHDGSSFSRTFFPFAVPGGTKQWTVVMDLPTSIISAPVQRQTFIVLAGGLVILGLTTLGLWLAVGRVVRKPLNLIGQRMQALARGDLDVVVSGQERADEIGTMAKAVQVFKDNALRTQMLEREAEVRRNQSEEERQRLAEQERARAEAMTEATSGLATGLKHLSAGDLTCTLNQPFAAEFENLRADFNRTVEQLRIALSSVAQATDSIDGGSREISQSADDLSKRTEQQAASLEETAAALDEITANVANSSKRADEARAVAIQANESARQSGAVVANAVNAMGRIEESSGQISSIIGVIDDIAFQTNLLALNAGVEAARAGEAGKGFAVVAQEVRELAQRSAKAAKEIKDLISKSTLEVGAGVRLVSDTGAALKTIESYIVTINQHMDSIATSAREQSLGLAEVNTAVNQMDQVTQQNAAMVEEANAAGVTLATESARLRELIAQFQLGDGTSKSSALRTTAGVMKSSQAIEPVTSPARRMVGKLTRAFAGAKSNAAVASWEEF